LKIWGRLKRFKLKIFGLCFIFILTTPVLLPTISSSLIQTRNNEQLNDVSIFIFLDFSQKKIPDPNEFLMEEKSSNPDLDEIEVKLLASIYQVGGLTARNCKIEWDENSVYYNHPFEEEIVVNSQILTIKFSADIMYGPIADPVPRTYPNLNITSQADFDNLVYTTLLGDKLYYSLDFPAVCFASNLTVQQDGQEVVDIDTNKPFKVNFSLNNLKPEIFQGNWTLYQKIGDAENSSLFSDGINMGEGIQWVEQEINLIGENVTSDTPITYHLEIESDSFWQKTEEVYVMANPTKPFIAGIELEWEEWYELGIFNYGEPYTITIDILNPTSNSYTDILIINETLGEIYNNTLFNDLIILEPDEHCYITIEEQVIDWEKWKWFNNETGDVYETSLIYKLHTHLDNFNLKGMDVRNTVHIQGDKSFYASEFFKNLFFAAEKLGIFHLLDQILYFCTWTSVPVNVILTIIAFITGQARIGAITLIYDIFCFAVFVYKEILGLEYAENIGEMFKNYILYCIDPPIISDISSLFQNENFNSNCNCSNCSILNPLIEYTNLLKNLTANMVKITEASTNYYIASSEGNKTERILQANLLKNHTNSYNSLLIDNISKIEEEALITKYIYKTLSNQLNVNNISFDNFVSNLTFIGQLIKNNQTLKLELINAMQDEGYEYNETDFLETVNFLLNSSQFFEELIDYENKSADNIRNFSQNFSKNRSQMIKQSNLAIDEIVSLSSLNITSNISVVQNYEASKRADINIFPTSIHIAPGEVKQFEIEIENLYAGSEHFNILLENLPVEWNVNYQSELIISGYNTTRIPINISIPKSAYEFPRVVPINIIISNTVVDYKF